jgi:uncharacterized protein YuzB (UPF0349 family)
MDGIGLHMTSEEVRDNLQEQIEHYADQVCRGSIVDNTVDALFAAIDNELRNAEVPEEIYQDVFDYLNSTFHVS